MNPTVWTPEDVKEQRLALAKWIASKRHTCDFDGRDYARILDMLARSGLFPHRPGPIYLSDKTRAVANTIRMSIKGGTCTTASSITESQAARQRHEQDKIYSHSGRRSADARPASE